MKLSHEFGTNGARKETNFGLEKKKRDRTQRGRSSLALPAISRPSGREEEAEEKGDVTFITDVELRRIWEAKRPTEAFSEKEALSLLLEREMG
jgi:hypothetical protein